MLDAYIGVVSATSGKVPGGKQAKMNTNAKLEGAARYVKNAINQNRQGLDDGIIGSIAYINIAIALLNEAKEEIESESKVSA